MNNESGKDVEGKGRVLVEGGHGVWMRDLGKDGSSELAEPVSKTRLERRTFSVRNRSVNN